MTAHRNHPAGATDAVARPVRRGAGLVVAACVLGLLASACSRSSTDSASTPGAGSTPLGAQGGQVDVTIAPSGTPTPGGTLTYGLEAETDGWNPATQRWAISGTMVGLAVMDPLVAMDVDSKPRPYLAESLTPNAGFTEWTVKVRPGITFQDGTPVNAAAVKKVYDAHLTSILTKPAMGPMTAVDVVDDLTVKFTMSAPWAVFPAALTGQIGVIPAPVTMDDAGGTTLVGSGPFAYKDGSWVKGSQIETTKNPNYWRTDSSGAKLPYLDGVTFRILLEDNLRVDALKNNAIQMFHSTDGPTIEQLRADAAAGTLQLVEDKGETEEGFVLLNNSRPPFDDVTARRALAYATDAASYTNFINNGVNLPADGPFTPNSPWRAETDYPKYDEAMAKKLVDEYKAAHGGEFRFTLKVGGPDSRPDGEFLADLYKAAGMEVDVQVEDQNTFIRNALTGEYQANLWRLFGAPDPDYENQWWRSDSGLNFARYKSAQVDAALQKARGTDDPAVRREALAEIQKQFATDIPYVWLEHETWVVAATNAVRSITNGPLPDGQASLPIGGSGFPGVHRLTQVWLQK